MEMYIGEGNVDEKLFIVLQQILEIVCRRFFRLLAIYLLSNDVI